MELETVPAERFGNPTPGVVLLDVKDLAVAFPIRSGLLQTISGRIQAVNHISLQIKPGETLGLVGESGCGKTTAGRAILRLIPSGAAEISGQVLFEGTDIYATRPAKLRSLRRHIQVIFQDPIGSLNPRMTVGSMIGEPLLVHRLVPTAAIPARVAALLEKVGFSADVINRYPHEFSGGQRQRIGIARALALNPRLIVCDEPVSALDVSIQAQVLNLLSDLQTEMGLSYLFIAHNLAVVEHFSDRIAVMYLGRIVETAAARTLTGDPKHPYTQALLSAVPQPEVVRKTQHIVLPGEVPSPANPPSGCPFHPRCPIAREHCKQEIPPMEIKSGDSTHWAACWETH
ncbi:MAG: ABC transporter ATP-binding protein [Phycisphaerae bacterium]